VSKSLKKGSQKGVDDQSDGGGGGKKKREGTFSGSNFLGNGFERLTQKERKAGESRNAEERAQKNVLMDVRGTRVTLQGNGID